MKTEPTTTNGVNDPFQPATESNITRRAFLKRTASVTLGVILATGMFSAEVRAEMIGSTYYLYTLQLTQHGGPMRMRSLATGLMITEIPTGPGDRRYSLEPIPETASVPSFIQATGSGEGAEHLMNEENPNADYFVWYDYEITLKSRPKNIYTQVDHSVLGVGFFSETFEFGWHVDWVVRVRDWQRENWTQEEQEALDAAIAAWDAAHAADPNADIGARPEEHVNLSPTPGPISSGIYSEGLM